MKNGKKWNMFLSLFVIAGLFLFSVFIVFHKGELPKNPMEMGMADASKDYELSSETLDISKETFEAWKNNGFKDSSIQDVEERDFFEESEKEKDEENERVEESNPEKEPIKNEQSKTETTTGQTIPDGNGGNSGNASNRNKDENSSPPEETGEKKPLKIEKPSGDTKKTEDKKKPQKSNLPAKKQENKKEEDSKKTETKDQDKNELPFETEKEPENQPPEIVTDTGMKLDIQTTLYDQTVQEDRIVFQAKIVNGTKKAKLTVIAGGNVLHGNDGDYAASLQIGKNTIRLKAVDTGGVIEEKKFVIEYLPSATEETKPRLVSINVSDGMEIGGSSFTLDVQAQDAQGNPLYYESLCVKLNGKEISYRWSAGEKYSYYLELESGENHLELRLTDHQGRYADFGYQLNCTYIAEGTPIGSVFVSMDASVLLLPPFLNQTKVDIYYGDHLSEVTERVLLENGFGMKYSGSIESGFYLEAVERPGITDGWRIEEGLLFEIEEDGLMLNQNPKTGEFFYQRDSLGQLDYCQGSGWMYVINGNYMSNGMSDYEVKDGDQIFIRFTLAYGKDLGAYNSSGGSQGIKDHYEHTYPLQ